MEPASLLRFLRKLKEVFDVCDEDADGFIRVEHFVALGLQFGQGDEVSGATPGPARPGPARPAGPDPGSRATFTCRSGYARSGPRLCLARARQDHPDHPPPPPLRRPLSLIAARIHPVP